MITEQLTMDILKDIVSKNFKLVHESSIQYFNHNNAEYFLFGIAQVGDIDAATFKIVFGKNNEVNLLNCFTCIDKNQNEIISIDGAPLKLAPSDNDSINNFISNNSHLLYKALSEANNNNNIKTNQPNVKIKAIDPNNLPADLEKVLNEHMHMQVKRQKLFKVKYICSLVVLSFIILFQLVRLMVPEIADQTLDELILLTLVYLILK